MNLDHLRQVFVVLWEQKIYAMTLLICLFLTTNMTFLRYIIIAQGVKVDPSKIDVITIGLLRR